MSDVSPSLASRPQTTAEIKYRILFLSCDGRVMGAEPLMASSDNHALAIARDKIDGRAVELWDGLRFIEHFDVRTDQQPSEPVCEQAMSASL